MYTPYNVSEHLMRLYQFSIVDKADEICFKRHYDIDLIYLFKVRKQYFHLFLLLNKYGEMVINMLI